MNRTVDIPNAKPGFGRWLIVLSEVIKRQEPVLSYSDKKQKTDSMKDLTKHLK